MLAVCGMDIQRAREPSGAIEPITAPNNDQVIYEAPIRKEAAANTKKLLNEISIPVEMQHKIIETDTAPAFVHLSPTLPKQTPSNAEPRKVIDPKMPILKLLREYTSPRNGGINGPIRSVTNIAAEKRSDQTRIFLLLNETEGNERCEGRIAACWLLTKER